MKAKYHLKQQQQPTFLFQFRIFSVSGIQIFVQCYIDYVSTHLNLK